jgi:hypothetical protein
VAGRDALLGVSETAIRPALPRGFLESLPYHLFRRIGDGKFRQLLARDPARLARVRRRPQLAARDLAQVIDQDVVVARPAVGIGDDAVLDR